ncbi:U7 snRNA-associated Sm-like protein LSm10 [Frankliniella fusca]|uniref:U7 snRNA-associated Sm-like protein LSm10 n=1 Tax=Frankliniella fusca TaxID=407009 RepID=A0AAE1I492_9NEOP|nr:U7 snRNA-associated Sm-like protein LSm10 [Frankliniella fusca]
MEPSLTSKERHLTYNTLVSLLMSLKGQQTTVDLRNRSSVTGTIERCDAYMNMELKHVLFRDTSGKAHIFEYFFVNKRNLRYVHIPPEVNMRKSVETFLGNLNPRQQEPQKVKLLTLRKQRETIARVQRIKAREADKKK